MQPIAVEWLFSVDYTFNNHFVMHNKNTCRTNIVRSLLIKDTNDKAKYF